MSPAAPFADATIAGSANGLHFAFREELSSARRASDRPAARTGHNIAPEFPGVADRQDRALMAWLSRQRSLDRSAIGAAISSDDATTSNWSTSTRHVDDVFDALGNLSRSLS
jgi:hypothetical protein